ncbi:MAG TPA: acylphosphatase [Blastocatellia bacterium]
MTVARRFVVKGRVQGVGYRYFAIRAANECGVVGTVKNLADGSVEAVAEGSREAINQFRAELERGPAYARVTGVQETPLEPTGRYHNFDVAF